MKIEVLYLPDCPHHPAAIMQLREVSASEGIPAEIHEVAVPDARTAEALRFYGSPTIRINGRDIAGESEGSEDFAMSCRLYPGAEPAGVPRVEMIPRTVREACGRDKP